MLKKNMICSIISILVMLLFPWCAVTFVKGDSGMAVCFLLFFVINPILSISMGFFSGKNIKTSWFQPLLSAILFLMGTWLFFDIGETAFIIYAVVYLVLGYITAAISWSISKY